MLTSVLNICPDKTKEFVHRDIRTKKLLFLVPRVHVPQTKSLKKSARNVAVCKFYVSM